MSLSSQPRRSWPIGKALEVFAPMVIAGLVGCSSPSPTLYTASMVPGPTLAGGPKVVVVREISLTPYLQRQPIVRSSAGYRIDVMGNDWWGEPPAAMLTRVLVEDLNQRLPSSAVVQERGAVSSATDTTVIEVNISQLDADANGQIVLQAAAGIDSGPQKAPQPRKLRFATTPGAGVAGEVAAISVLMGQLADKLAFILASR